MMPRKGEYTIDVNDIVGMKFGEMTVVRYFGTKEYGKKNKRNFHTYECVCSCGNKRVVIRKALMTDDIRSGTKSCGCMTIKRSKEVNTTHGFGGSRIYSIYYNMIRRCYDENDKNYNRYGGRGISVCEEWKDDKNGLNNFAVWANSNGYNKKLTIDRIDVNGDYCPDNCRWATAKEQSVNKELSIKMKAISPTGEVFDEVVFIIDFAKKNNLTPSKIYECIKGKYKTHKGWKFEKIN